MGALDLPPEPEEADRDRDRDRDREAGRPKARDLPEPGERGRVYEAMRAHVSAETRHEPGGSYQDEVPGFLQRAADHLRRWPEERRPAPDRSADSPGSFRSAGGYLGPERHAEVIAEGRRIREAEPRISADMRTVERENEQGGWLAGLKFCLKGEDRLKEKVAEQQAAEPDKMLSEILRRVPDAIRYTFCFEPGNYVEGYYDIKERLENLGYEMYQSRNSWDAAEYKGINTRWVTADGQRFEVQIHTAEGFHAKQRVTHDAYERIRNPLTSYEERRELEAFQCEVSSWITVPSGATDIPDFRKEGF